MGDLFRQHRSEPKVFMKEYIGLYGPHYDLVSIRAGESTLFLKQFYRTNNRASISWGFDYHGRIVSVCTNQTADPNIVGYAVLLKTSFRSDYSPDLGITDFITYPIPSFMLPINEEFYNMSDTGLCQHVLGLGHKVADNLKKAIISGNIRDPYFPVSRPGLKSLIDVKADDKVIEVLRKASQRYGKLVFKFEHSGYLHYFEKKTIAKSHVNYLADSNQDQSRLNL